MNLKYTELVNRIEENLKQINADLAELKRVAKLSDDLVSIGEEIAEDMELKEQAK